MTRISREYTREGQAPYRALPAEDVEIRKKMSDQKMGDAPVSLTAAGAAAAAAQDLLTDDRDGSQFDGAHKDHPLALSNVVERLLPGLREQAGYYSPQWRDLSLGRGRGRAALLDSGIMPRMTTRSSSVKDQRDLRWCGMTGGVIESFSGTTARTRSGRPGPISEEGTALAAAASQDAGQQPDPSASVAAKGKKPAPPRSPERDIELQEMGARPKIRKGEGTNVGGDTSGRRQSTPHDEEKRLTDYDDPMYAQWRRELQQIEERKDTKRDLQRKDTDDRDRVHGHEKDRERNPASAQLAKAERHSKIDSDPSLAFWNYLCEGDVAFNPLGVKPDRVYYSGKICDAYPGDRPGLRTEFCPTTRDLAYYISLETAEKALMDVLAVARDEVAEMLKKEGIHGARELRSEWGRILKGVIHEDGPGQLTELWRRTNRVIEQWQMECIDGYVTRQSTLSELESDTEMELDRREDRMTRRAELRKRRKATGGQRSLGALPPSSRTAGRAGKSVPSEDGGKELPPPIQESNGGTQDSVDILRAKIKELEVQLSMVQDQAPVSRTRGTAAQSETSARVPSEMRLESQPRRDGSLAGPTTTCPSTTPYSRERPPWSGRPPPTCMNDATSSHPG